MEKCNHMEEVAKILGVELGEEFDIDGCNMNPYHLEKGGLFNREYATSNVNLLAGILRGYHKIIKKPWVPKRGEVVYQLVCYDSTIVEVGKCLWIGSTFDLMSYKLGFTFRTPEEALINKERFLRELIIGD